MTSLPPPVPIALLGFSEFERSALLVRFQASGLVPGTPGLRFERVLGVDEARFIVADGDQPGALALLEQLGRVEDAVFVGAYAPRQAAAWLMRPMAPDAVLRELAELKRQRDIPDSTPLPLPLPWSQGSGFSRFDSPAPLPTPWAGRRAHDASADAHLEPGALDRPDSPSGQPADRAADGPAGPGQASAAQPLARLRAPAAPVIRPLVLPRALLVDDSAIALHFLRRQLLPYGLAIDQAQDSHQALDALATQAYGLVFLDVDLGEASPHDGLDLCHLIRHGLQHTGPVPMVVMVSALHSPVHQVRSTLAGAEACLGKPLDAVLLRQLMRRLGFVPAGQGGAPVHAPGHRPSYRPLS